MQEAYYEVTQNGGIRKLFRGFKATLIYGYIVNLVILPVYDYIYDRLNN